MGHDQLTHPLGSLVHWLTQRINYERQLPRRPDSMRLEGIQDLLERLGNPQLAYPIVHIAGTKGKGSVTWMLSRMLCRAGYKTATYTSPHLKKLNERFEIDGRAISDDELADLIESVRPAVAACDDHFGEPRLTFFDILTALAFLYAARRGVQIAVIETGLGGRLDSTNVCQSVLAIITSISFDHMRQLGNTLSSIAWEKAGIIKKRVPVVIGKLPEEAREVVLEVARQNEAPVWQSGVDFWATDVQLTASGARFSFSALGSRPSRQCGTLATATDDSQIVDDLKTAGTGTVLPSLFVPALGAHQVENASLALAAATILESQGFTQLTASAADALAALKLPGRIQVVCEKPTLVLDVAHNVAAIEALLATLNRQLPSWKSARKRWLILAISRDKDYEGMIALMAPHFDHVLLTRFLENPRARQTSDLRRAFEKALTGAGKGMDRPKPLAAKVPLTREFESPVAAWQTAWSEMAPDDFCCIAGSLFLAAEIAALIEKTLGDIMI